MREGRKPYAHTHTNARTCAGIHKGTYRHVSMYSKSIPGCEQHIALPGQQPGKTQAYTGMMHIHISWRIALQYCVT